MLTDSTTPRPGLSDGPALGVDWLKATYPRMMSAPLARRHRAALEWFDALGGPQPLDTTVWIWPRGGGKTTIVQVGVALVAKKRSKHFVLFVTRTQDQADRHISTIASLLEAAGIERSVGEYGHPKGWKRNRLQADGFNVEGIGLDKAVRGIKIEEYRPDLIIFDDIDSLDDSLETIEKKIRAVTDDILAAGSVDCDVAVFQNLIRPDGIVARLKDGKADFLHDRKIADFEKAVVGLEVEKIDRPDGARVYRITGGEPTWEGQGIKECERAINKRGLRSFLRESQHEVEFEAGGFFDVTSLRYCDLSEVPPNLRYARAWDLAATEGRGDYTVGTLGGMGKNGVLYIIDVCRGQWSTEKVYAAMARCAQQDLDSYKRVRVLVPEDPGQAGKAQTVAIRKELAGFEVSFKSVSGSKAVRARPLQARLNKGNVVLVRADWNEAWREEFRLFTETDDHERDDQVDSGADLEVGLAPRATTGGISTVAPGAREDLRLGY